MELDSSLSRLALALTAGLASRLSGRLLEEFGSPGEMFRAPLPRLERCRLPAAVAQAVFQKQAFKRAEKELVSIRGIENCRLVNRTDPECPRTLLEIRSALVVVGGRGCSGAEPAKYQHRRDPPADAVWDADGGAQAEQRDLLVAASLNSSEKIYDLLNSDEAVHIDDIVVRSGLNSSEVLATLFDLEMKGIVRKMPGKQFNKVPL